MITNINDFINEGKRMDLLKKVAFAAGLIASLASCRKPLDPEPDFKNTQSISKDTISVNPKDTIHYNDTISVNPKDTSTHKDTISVTPKDTTHNAIVRNDIYGNWLCTTICQANPSFQPDKLSWSNDVFTWYIWGRTVASHGDAYGYNSVTYYNINTLSSVDPKDETKLFFFDYNKSSGIVKFYCRVTNGVIIPNLGVIPEVNNEQANLSFDKQANLLFFHNFIYTAIK